MKLPTMKVHQSLGKKIYDIFKKLLDPVDDIFAIIRASLMSSKGLLSESAQKILDIVGPILIGAIGFILHAVEFFNAIKNLYKLYQKKMFGFFQTLIPNYNLILTGTGIGLSITLIAGTLGAPVAALALVLAPMLIPTLLLFVYVNKFIKNCITLSQEKTDSHALKFASLPNHHPAITRKNELATVTSLHKKKCKVAFSCIECVAAALVVTGIVTGLFPIIIAGVALGFASKIFEKIDEKNNYSLSLSIKHFFTRSKKSIDVSTTTQPTLLKKPLIIVNTDQFIKEQSSSLPTKNIPLQTPDNVPILAVAEEKIIKKTQPIPIDRNTQPGKMKPYSLFNKKMGNPDVIPPKKTVTLSSPSL